ncbi:M48 family metalloprotease [Candidatus Gracilibacteria bacterium]|nr:M48 family metalloprotease [Candidatus Gracilibacteria bacterium]
MVFVLYTFTLFFELISVICRFALVYWPLSWFLDGPWALSIAGFAALTPLVYSLLVLCGVPSGHMLTRYRLGGRLPSPAEQALLDDGLRPLREQQLVLPVHIYVLERSGLNAAVSGTTLFVYRDLLRSPYLTAVVAHELGHLHGGDGRLLLALSALVIPGGYTVEFILLSALRLLVRGLVLVLIGCLSFLMVMFQIKLAWLVSPLLTIGVQLARYLVIFAVGGVGPSLLGSLWRAYFLKREYNADAFAVRCGYGTHLVSFFREAMLEDVQLPWNAQPTHPPTHTRVFAIQEMLAARPTVGVQNAASGRSRRASAQRSEVLARTIAFGSIAIVAFILIGTLLFSSIARSDSLQRIAPTPGPTPTLGIPVGSY